MKRTLFLSTLISIVVIAGYVITSRTIESQSHPGSQLISLSGESLLPDRSWEFSFRPPKELNEKSGFGLLVRRSVSKYDQSKPPSFSQRPLTDQDSAEAVLGSGLIMNPDPTEACRVGIQILDLRDYQDWKGDESPIRVAGGLQVGGTKTFLNRSDDFLVGKLLGHFVHTRSSWSGNQIPLVQFQTHEQDRLYTYDVVLVHDSDPKSP